MRLGRKMEDAVGSDLPEHVPDAFSIREIQLHEPVSLTLVDAIESGRIGRIRQRVDVVNRPRRMNPVQVMDQIRSDKPAATGYHNVRLGSLGQPGVPVIKVFN
jgi:hypothetical protein